MTNNDQVVKQVEQRVKQMLKTLPAMVGNEVVNFAKDNFRRQGFLGDSFQPWKQRKTKTAWGVTPRNKGRAILIDTGKLRRGNRVERADWSLITVANAIPYARAHNEGVRLGVIQTVKEHNRKKGMSKMKAAFTTVKQHKRRINMNIPKRQFLGDSPYLRRNIQRIIASQINKAIK
jgi:phage gpG-like protein